MGKRIAPRFPPEPSPYPSSVRPQVTAWCMKIWRESVWLKKKHYDPILEPLKFGKDVWFTLPETNSKFAPENRPNPKRKRVLYSNLPFSGAFAVSFTEGKQKCFFMIHSNPWSLEIHNLSGWAAEPASCVAAHPTSTFSKEHASDVCKGSM